MIIIHVIVRFVKIDFYSKITCPENVSLRFRLFPKHKVRSFNFLATPRLLKVFLNSETFTRKDVLRIIPHRGLLNNIFIKGG